MTTCLDVRAHIFARVFQAHTPTREHSSPLTSCVNCKSDVFDSQFAVCRTSVSSSIKLEYLTIEKSVAVSCIWSHFLLYMAALARENVVPDRSFVCGYFSSFYRAALYAMQPFLSQSHLSVRHVNSDKMNDNSSSFPTRRMLVGTTHSTWNLGPCKGPGILDVIAAEAGGGWVVVRASRAAGHASVDTCLHSPHAAASLVYSLSIFCCHPGMKEIKQDASYSMHAAKWLIRIGTVSLPILRCSV